MEARAGVKAVERAAQSAELDQRILGERDAEPMAPDDVATALGGSVVGRFTLTDDDRWLDTQTGEVHDHMPQVT